MRIVKVIGGLGNQMFQFALYKALQQQFPEERVLIDLHCFSGYDKHRGFELPTVFGIDYEAATLCETARLAYPYPNFQLWRIGSRLLPTRKTMLKERANMAYEPTALTRSSDTYYDGYWQHEAYFAQIRDTLLSTYRFPDYSDARSKALDETVSKSNSCAIHIRRGDYLTDPLRKGTTDGSYALDAIAEMRARRQPERWCIFSDDPDWCKAHLAKALEGEEAHYVDWNSGARSIDDMHLMSRCRHQIIANSSFSWWAAWLNQHTDKTVIAPDVWMSLKDTVSPVAQGWLQLKTLKGKR